jgi:hypothetical protein
VNIAFFEGMSLYSTVASYRLSSRLPPSSSTLKTKLADSAARSIANNQNARRHIPTTGTITLTFVRTSNIEKVFFIIIFDIIREQSWILEFSLNDRIRI